MHTTRLALVFAAACTTGVLCDFLGPTYPTPTDLASNSSLVPTAWKNLTSTLNGLINDGKTESPSVLKNLTFSIGMFSMHDPSAAKSLQFHHTSPEIANSSFGLKRVDGNSIYRLASISKLVTTFAGLLELADSDWDRPITEFVPSLATYAAANPADSDLVHTVGWNKVTLAALASQIAGNPRDVSPYDPSDLLLHDTTAEIVGSYGLPVLNESDPVAVPPCLVALMSNRTCSDDQYASGAQARPPLLLPWTSPAYTDFGFMLLGLAIANITGRSIHDVYSQSIFNPLGMTSSHSNIPNESQFGQYVIAGTIEAAGFTAAGGPDVTVPSGGIFSSTNDLAKLGIAVLNSTLLDADQTRKWMKPVSHTAMLDYAIGKPWEIYRYNHPRTGLVTDIYTKLGDSGFYGGYIALIPDFDAGFSIIGASSLKARSAQTALLADLVTEKMLPALTSQAEAEAKRNLAGTYTSEDESLNSTLILAIDPKGQPGLVITHFISNGTDVLHSGLIGRSPVRLLHSISDLSNGQIAFRASSSHPPSGGLFSRQYNANLDWLAGDSPVYGGVGIGLYVFDVGADGKAAAVSPAAWRIRLVKSS